VDGAMNCNFVPRATGSGVAAAPAPAFGVCGWPAAQVSLRDYNSDGLVAGPGTA
jgi:hypothetical protein